jgi:hypothetical protein
VVVDVVKPRWTSSSFLLYLGAFTILGSMVGAYAYLASLYGDVAFVGWTVLVLAVLLVLAFGFRRRGAWLTGGLFAYLTVAAFGTFVAALLTWWGWGDAGNTDASPFHGWNWTVWLTIVLVLVASTASLRRYRFPLFVLTICVLVWFLVTDVVSGGGSWSAVVTLAFGFLYFFVGLATNRVYGFWVHVVAGGLVAGALLYWWHASTAGWWLLAAVSVLFVATGVGVRRSSWTVIGAIGLFAASTHFSIDWTTGSFTFFTGPTRVWVPIVVAAVLGFVYVALGLLAARRDATAE